MPPMSQTWTATGECTSGTIPARPPYHLPPPCRWQLATGNWHPQAADKDPGAFGSGSIFSSGLGQPAARVN